MKRDDKFYMLSINPSQDEAVSSDPEGYRKAGGGI